MASNLRSARATTEPGRPRTAHSPVQVVLADDHQAARRSLRLLLNGEQDVDVIAEAGDLVSALREVSRHRPHELLLDLPIPNRSSLEVIRRLRTQAPETEIVVVTMEDSPAFAQRVMDFGAVGYVLKENADSELPVAIRCAARGEEYLSPRVAAHLGAIPQADDGDRLSPRQTDVLRLTALGFTSTEIAHQLHLSTRTVESHRMRIHHKLLLTTRAELVRYALEHRLIGNPPDAAHVADAGQ
jgi:two-component system, NarL family, response regulator NreC